MVGCKIVSQYCQ